MVSKIGQQNFRIGQQKKYLVSNNNYWSANILFCPYANKQTEKYLNSENNHNFVNLKEIYGSR